MKEVQEHKGDFADFGYNHHDFKCKVPFEINRASPFSTSTSVNTCVPFLPAKRFSWKRLAFGKYALQPIILSVLKLDGSSFDIIVTKKATVAKVKQAVEAAFSHLPRQGDGKVSWSHVWGHFCLCFKDQKLLRDRDSIVLYGIQNGDQLRFVRHTPVYNLAWERSEKLAYSLDESEGSSSKWDDWNNSSNLVRNQVNEAGYVDFGANTRGRSKLGGCSGLFSHPRPAKGNDSWVRLGRSFPHDDDPRSSRETSSCRFDAGSKRYGCGISDPSFPFNGFAGGFSYPTGYCMK